MRIVHIARDPRTGVWSAIKTLALAQKAKGHDVHIRVMATRSWPYRPELATLPLDLRLSYTPELRWNMAYLFHRVFWSPITDWLNELNRDNPTIPTVAHFHNAWLSGNLVLSQRHRPPNVSQVVTFHGVAAEAKLRRYPLLRALHRWMASPLRNNITITSVARETIPTISYLFRIDPAVVVYVPNGVEVPPSLNSTAPDLGLRVCHVGVIDHGKGWRFTALAVKALHHAGLKVSFTVAGSGPEDHIARDWCHAHREFACFVGRINDPPRTLMPHVNVLVLPSLTEGLPMAILEAMANGVIVVATSVGAIPTVITEKETGLIVQRSVEDIQNALRTLYFDLALRRKLAIAAYQRVKEQYSVSVVADQYARIYNQMTQARERYS